jgi:hypothetical protein
MFNGTAQMLNAAPAGFGLASVPRTSRRRAIGRLNS